MKEKVAALRVSIPVKISGHTGQYDSYEEFEQPYYVGLFGETVVLTDGSTIPGRIIEFPLSGLEAAVKILKDYEL